MSIQEIKNQMTTKIAALGTKELCEAFEITNDKNDANIPMIRGMLMNELENRNPVVFDAWMNEEDPAKMDYPTNFFSA